MLAGLAQSSATLVNHDHLFLCHFQHGRVDAFAAHAGAFVAAVGHVVDAAGGEIVDHDAADMQGIDGIVNMAEMIAENRRLQAKFGAVDIDWVI